MKKLFLLDGMALIYRAYFALSKTPRLTSYGLNTGAIMGFTNTLLDVLKNQKPTHIAVVFDTAAPTNRHLEFESYKAEREQMPEDLAASIPYINRLIEGFNIPIITMDGFEADDIIGTLVKRAESQGFESFMVTPDKDFAQLVRPRVTLVNTMSGSRLDSDAAVIEALLNISDSRFQPGLIEQAQKVGKLPNLQAREKADLEKLRKDLTATTEYAPFWVILAVALALGGSFSITSASQNFLWLTLAGLVVGVVTTRALLFLRNLFFRMFLFLLHLF